MQLATTNPHTSPAPAATPSNHRSVAVTPPAFFLPVGDVVGTYERAPGDVVDVAMAGILGTVSGYQSLDDARTALARLTADGGRDAHRTVGVMRADDRFYGVGLVSLPRGSRTPAWSNFLLRATKRFVATNDPADDGSLVALVDGTRWQRVSQAEDPEASRMAERLTTLLPEALPGAKVSRSAQSPNTLVVDLPTLRQQLVARSTFADEIDGLKLDFRTRPGQGHPDVDVTFDDLYEVLGRIDHLYFEEEERLRGVSLSDAAELPDARISAAAQRPEDMWMMDLFNGDHVWLSDEPNEM